MKRQMQLTLPNEVMEALRSAAVKKGITPNILARMILHEHFAQPDAEAKSYTFTSKNWREIEAYVEAKQLGNIGVFATYAMELAMSRAPLSDTQKARVGKTIDE